MKKNFFIILFFSFLSLYIHAQFSDIALPLINIETINGEMPTRTVVNAPEGCIGNTITDNNYVPGRMMMTLQGKILYDSQEYEQGVSGMRIKIRGNSTGAYLSQHPYKLKLSKKYDLLERNDNTYQHKEWLLLSMYVWNPIFINQENNILLMLGLMVSKIVGQEWVPEYQLVNVILNGEYQGMYYLMESVSKGKRRINVENTGFIIEYDPFWWNEDVYFKTDYQESYYGYTYKYPDSDDVTEDIQNTLQNYMNSVENAIYNNGDISQYIDIVSFAKWILIHDILGSYDSAGCNKFLYRKDHNSLLQIGPTWDFDTTFRCNGFSRLHDSDHFFYPYLFKNTEFKQAYCQLWNTIKPTLLQEIISNFGDLWQKYGHVFDENMKLHQTKYANEGKNSFQSQIHEIIDNMTERINQLDNLIITTNNIDNAVFYDTDDNQYIYNMNGQRIKSSDRLTKGIYIKNRQKFIYE